MRILYLAWLREKAGLAEEQVSPPQAVTSVESLIAWIRERGGGPANALADLATVRVAVNQEYAALDHPVQPGDEVAFFPPVTGG